MGCDGPMGICQLPRDQGGFGCPIHKCMPQGKIDWLSTWIANPLAI